MTTLGRFTRWVCAVQRLCTFILLRYPQDLIFLAGLRVMNRTEVAQTDRLAASGIDGLAVVATPWRAGPAALASMSVSLRLPYAKAQGLAGRSVPVPVPVLFEVTRVPPRAVNGPATPAIQAEKSTFFVPR